MDESRQIIVFTLGDEEYGINISEVNIIERPMEIFEVPGVPDYVEGLINLRGQIHTIFNLRRRFGMPDAEFLDDEDNENVKIIIVDVDSSLIGIRVDSIKKIAVVPSSELKDAPDTIGPSLKKFIAGVAELDGKTVMLLDLKAIVNIYEP